MPSHKITWPHPGSSSLRMFGLGLLVVAVALAAPVPEPNADQPLAQIAAGDKKFSKLKAALEATGLTELLRAPGPITLLAPTDRAFEALGEPALQALLADRERLRSVLSYHIVKGKAVAADVAVLARFEKTLNTLNGAEIKLAIQGNRLTVGGATIVEADQLGNNGVLHAIDRVLLPPGDRGNLAVNEKARKLCPPVISPQLYGGTVGRVPSRADKEKFAALFEEVAQQAPPKGDREEWKKRNLAIAAFIKKNATETDAEKIEQARANLVFTINCVACHTEHKR